ncbi:MAG: hypothetical protein LBE12_16550 [Planctomycetaceae bacterium]|jgi:hypothetical protein|nr:hypothetical protein [Planctomycetaceae bacterium]
MFYFQINEYSDDDGKIWKGKLVIDKRCEISYLNGFQHPTDVFLSLMTETALLILKF